MTENENKTVAGVVVTLKENGLISIDAVEGYNPIAYEETEELLRKAHQRMVENRIIANTINALVRSQETAAAEKGGQ